MSAINASPQLIQHHTSHDHYGWRGHCCYTVKTCDMLCAYRIKSGLMHVAAVGHDDVFEARNGITVNRKTAGWQKWWSDDEAAWYRCIPCRGLENKMHAARIMLTFARAYIVSLTSAKDDPRFDPGTDRACKSPIELLQEIKQSANADGEVTMSSIIQSFQWCPGKVFCDTLSLLTWAGHIGSFSTLAHYRFVITAVVAIYWSGRSQFLRNPNADHRVCYSCMAHACIHAAALLRHRAGAHSTVYI